MEKVKIQRKKHIKTKDTINLSAYLKFILFLFFSLLVVYTYLYKKRDKPSAYILDSYCST